MATGYIFILTQVTNRTLKTSYALPPSECTHLGTSKNSVRRTDISRFPIMHSNGSSSHCCLGHPPSPWASHFRKLKSLWQNAPRIQQNVPNICFKFLNWSSFSLRRWSSSNLCIRQARTIFALPKVLISGKREMDPSSDSTPLPLPVQDCFSHPHIPFNLHAILPTLDLTLLFLGLCALIFFLQIINPRMWTSGARVQRSTMPSDTGIAYGYYRSIKVDVKPLDRQKSPSLPTM